MLCSVNTHLFPVWRDYKQGCYQHSSNCHWEHVGKSYKVWVRIYSWVRKSHWQGSDREEEEILQSGGLLGRAYITSWSLHHTCGVQACVSVHVHVCVCVCVHSHAGVHIRCWCWNVFLPVSPRKCLQAPVNFYKVTLQGLFYKVLILIHSHQQGSHRSSLALAFLELVIFPKVVSVKTLPHWILTCMALPSDGRE